MIKNLLMAALLTTSCWAVPVDYTSLASFNTAVGPHTIITFTGLTEGIILSNQFVGQGVTFTDGNDSIFTNVAFVVDSVGVSGNASISLTFSSSLNAIGAEFPGALQLELFQGATSVYTSSQFANSGTGFFGGVTGVTFDRAIIRDWTDDAVFIDNLHFTNITSSVPEPSTAGLLLLAFPLFAVVRKRLAK